jgi:hypothetical protein
MRAMKVPSGYLSLPERPELRIPGGFPVYLTVLLVPVTPRAKTSKSL